MSEINAREQNKSSERRSVLDMTAKEAKAFFLKSESYSRIELPPYYRFDNLLNRVNEILTDKNLKDLSEKPRDHDDVNHRLLDNKDGRHAWRPMELVHPAIYIALADAMTFEDNWTTILKRFQQFQQDTRIHCLSLPIESLTDAKDKAARIRQWWLEIEQRSIELALDYPFIIHADITDCYGAIYTHSIAWALHGKDMAKVKRRDSSLIGNVIDSYIQDMRHGQTNGIPQGSVLIDFVAEMVLGYADLEFGQRLDNEDCLVLRFRDDYRIFVKHSKDADTVLKHLTEILIGLGLKLNASKTRVCDDVIRESVKADKLAWIGKVQTRHDLLKSLLIIYQHSIAFPNSGSVAVALGQFHRRVAGAKPIPRPLPLISVIAEIAFRNPRTYSVCAAILSNLLANIDPPEERMQIIERILTKFSGIPNTGHLEIWLQRISLDFAPAVTFNEPLCKLVQREEASIWNCSWIKHKELVDALNASQIFDSDMAKVLAAVIPPEELEVFPPYLG